MLLQDLGLVAVRVTVEMIDVWHGLSDRSAPGGETIGSKDGRICGCRAASAQVKSVHHV